MPLVLDTLSRWTSARWLRTGPTDLPSDPNEMRLLVLRAAPEGAAAERCAAAALDAALDFGPAAMGAAQASRAPSALRFLAAMRPPGRGHGLVSWTRIRDAGVGGAAALFVGASPVEAFVESDECREVRHAAEMGTVVVRTLGAPVATRLDRPVFVVAAPRSGSTLLFETIRRCADVWSIGQESHRVVEAQRALRPFRDGHDSHRLTAVDATPRVGRALSAGWVAGARDHAGRLLAEVDASERPAAVRFVEKTPRNALRIPFLRALYPDALFVVLRREPRGNIASIIEGWRSGRFRIPHVVPEVPGGRWSFLLPPGWRSVAGATLTEIAAFQWRATNETLLDDLAGLPRASWCATSYERLLADPAGELRALCDFAGLPLTPRAEELTRGGLPIAANTLSSPARDKWRRTAPELEMLSAPVREMAARLDDL